jgi:hypothetical protein
MCCRLLATPGKTGKPLALKKMAYATIDFVP